MYDMTLRRGSINVLTNILAAPGWYEGKADVAYIAGTILVNVLPDLTEEERPGPEIDGQGRAKPPKLELIKTWLEKAFKIKMSEKERDVVKTCMRFNLSASKLQVNRYMVELMDVFGFKPEEKKEKAKKS